MRSGDTLHDSLPTSLPVFLPDPLTDTQRRRSVATNRRKKYGEGLLARLLSATDGLNHVMLPLWHGPATDLYDHGAKDRARDVTAAVVGDATAWVKLEHAGQLHAHLMVDASAALLLPRGAKVEPVYNAERLMRYLSKPGDSRACLVRQKDPTTGRTITSTDPDPDALLEAYRDYMLARALAGGRRFPRLSWTHNLPLMRADVDLEATG